MDTDGTSLLGNAHQRRFYFLAGGHDHVAELIDDTHDVGHVLIFLLAVLIADFPQLATPHFIVVAHITHLHFLKHLVAVFHFLYKAIEGLDDAVGVGNDGLLFTRSFGKEVFFQISIDTELHTLGVNEN